MNTKKLIFGILACLTLMAASAGPYSVDNQDTGVKGKKISKPKR